MKQIAKKNIAVIFLLLMCLSISGCMNIDTNLRVKKDGAVDLECKVLGLPAMQQAIEGIKKNLASKGATLVPITEGDLTGFRAENKYASIEEFAKSDSSLVTIKNGKNKGVQKDSNWFCDVYSFDLLLEDNHQPPPNNPAAQAVLETLEVNVSLDLPYGSIKNNADSVSNGGKTLHWDLAPTFLGGKDKNIQATFRIWNVTHIVIIITGAFILLILVIVASVLAFQAETDETKTAAAIMAAIFFLVLIGLSAFSAICILPEPEFKGTLSKKIETSSAPQARKASSSEKSTKQDSPKAARNTAMEGDAIHAVQTVAQKYRLPDTVEATSYGHNRNGSLSMLRSASGRRMFLIDSKNNRAAIVDFSPQIYNFATGKQRASSVVFKMTILDDVRDNDKNLGIWNMDDHTFVIHAQYKLGNEGEIVPGMLMSGNGGKPSRYDQYLNETKNVELANLFLTEMQALHADAARRGIQL